MELYDHAPDIEIVAVIAERALTGKKQGIQRKSREIPGMLTINHAVISILYGVNSLLDRTGNFSQLAGKQAGSDFERAGNFIARLIAR